MGSSVLILILCHHDALQILEQIEDKAVAVSICQALRQGLDDLSCVIFVVQFELRYLSSALTIEEHQELEQLCMGAQVGIQTNSAELLCVCWWKNGVRLFRLIPVCFVPDLWSRMQ